LKHLDGKIGLARRSTPGRVVNSQSQHSLKIGGNISIPKNQLTLLASDVEFTPISAELPKSIFH